MEDAWASVMYSLLEFTLEFTPRPESIFSMLYTESSFRKSYIFSWISDKLAISRKIYTIFEMMVPVYIF